MHIKKEQSDQPSIKTGTFPINLLGNPTGSRNEVVLKALKDANVNELYALCCITLKFDI